MSPVDELSKNSPFLLNQKFTKDDALKNCGDWVDNQSSHMEEKNEDSRPSQKRKQAPLHEDQCNSPDENDDADSIVSSACGNKRRRKAIKLKDEQLDLQCEWRNCDYLTCNLDQFVRHVSLHIPHLEVKVNEDQEGNGSVVYLGSFLLPLVLYLHLKLTLRLESLFQNRTTYWLCTYM
jgi:hypothetical protein